MLGKGMYSQTTEANQPISGNKERLRYGMIFAHCYYKGKNIQDIEKYKAKDFNKSENEHI